MLVTLDFTYSEHWDPFNFSQSTALMCTCMHVITLLWSLLHLLSTGRKASTESGWDGNDSKRFSCWVWGTCNASERRGISGQSCYSLVYDKNAMFNESTTILFSTVYTLKDHRNYVELSKQKWNHKPMVRGGFALGCIALASKGVGEEEKRWGGGAGELVIFFSHAISFLCLPCRLFCLKVLSIFLMSFLYCTKEPFYINFYWNFLTRMYAKDWRN